MTPLAPKFFILFASIANILKSLSGMITGATRATLNKHFSIIENMGDVTAKGYTQGIAGWLLGMSLGIGISMLPGMQPASPGVFLSVFCLGGVHLFASYKALSLVNLNTLNMQRTCILLDEFITNRQILSPDEVRKREKIILRPHFVSQAKIHLGSSVPYITSSTFELEKLLEIFKGEKYLLNFGQNGRGKDVFIVLHISANSLEILKAFFNGYYLATQTLQTRNDLSNLTESLEFTRKHFSIFLPKLVEHGWNTKNILLQVNEFRSEWDYS